MALQPDGGPAPYGPPSAVTAVVEAYRNRGLQTPFTPEVLIRAGVTEALAPRVLRSLRLLDLVDEGWNPSTELQGLRRAATDEFSDRFAAIILTAYAPIFSFVNPADATPERVRDAFRPYEPVGQQSRMVTLFLGLCEYAGLVERRPAPAQTTRPQVVRAPRPVGRARSRAIGTVVSPESNSPNPTGLPEALVALMRQALPQRGRSWTSDERDRFLETFTAVLNFSVPIDDTAPVVEPDDGDGGDEEGLV